MISGIIMASGFSKRFGERDKLLYEINNKTIIEEVCENALKSDLEEVILVYRNEKINKIIQKNKIKKIKNKNACKGMSESMKIGINKCNKNTKGYLFLMGDQPLINKEIINKLINSFKNNNCGKIILPIFNEKKSSPTLFPTKYKEELLKTEGDKGGRLLLNKYRKDIVKINFSNNKNNDIDKIEDTKKINL